MWISLLLYNVGLLITKLMFFFQYYRLVRQVSSLRRTYIGVMTVVVLWSVSQLIVLCTTCIPITGLWDPSVTATCSISPDVQMWMNSIGNIVTDVVVLILPIPVVWRLQLRKSQRLILTSIFCLGFL